MRTAFILLVIGVMLAFVVRAVRAEEAKFAIVVTQSIDGKPIHRFLFIYPTFELCFMNAVAVKKHYNLTWMPECKHIPADKGNSQ